MYDIIVIGGGPGGNNAAVQLAKYGKKTAIVERDAFGGTCLNRGCIPTKTLLSSSRLIEQLRSSAFGINAEGVEPDYEKLLAHKNSVVETLRAGSEKRLAESGVDIYRGEGFVEEPGKVKCSSADGSVTELNGHSIIIAVGSRPLIPSIPGTELQGVYTSDSMLETLPRLSRLTIIGGGVIGVEFASIYSGLGAEVTILEAQPRILSSMDRELAQSLSLSMKQKNISIITGAAVERIEQGDGLSCTYSTMEGGASVSSDAVLLAIGRSVNTENLFAASCVPLLDHGHVVIDERHQSSIPGIYAIGDIVAGGIQLAHAASSQAIALAARLAGVPRSIDTSLVPVCVYSEPEIASVGLTQAEAKAKGISIKTVKQAMSGSAMTLATGRDRGYIRLISGEDDKLLGAQLFCGHATEFIGEIALAIAKGLTAKELSELVRPHPTFEENITGAAEALAAK